MRWDDTIFTGTHGSWHWGVSRKAFRAIESIIYQYFSAKHVCFLAFDGGPITPNADESKIGWSVCNTVMISPPLSAGMTIPSADMDEWFVVENLPDAFPDLERFVNYLGLNLADPAEITASFDPSWDPKGNDWLYPLQERFWEQIEVLQPQAYIVYGDTYIAVSKDCSFVAACMKSAAENPYARR